MNGFAGFGTALVASGLWFLVLSPQIVPPLIILSAMAGQIVGLVQLSNNLNWRASSYLISGGLVGVPIGTGLLLFLNPLVIKTAIGAFLVGYALLSLGGWPRTQPRAVKDGFKDRLIGAIGGILGGFAGLSGPIPLIWLQSRGLSASEQRARYQPFNLLILSFSALALVFVGKLNATLLSYAVIAIPFSLIGATLGVKAFRLASDQLFRTIILGLLLLSGAVILAQGVLT